MNDLIPTTKGPIARSLLTVSDKSFDEPGKRIVATEWYLEGEMVRRDVWVNVLCGESTAAKQAQIG